MSDSIHFIGIGGIGMSAIAKIAIEEGMQVLGSDTAPSATTSFLQNLGAKIHFHQGQAALPKDATLVVSTATRNLKEVRRAERLGMKVLHRSEFLSALMEGTQQLLVAGTHGKTSTSALLTSVLMEADLDPSFCIGGIHKEFMTNGRRGKGSFFVAEADESDGTFLAYKGRGAIVTNIDDDHLDHFGTLLGVQGAFQQFFDRIDSKEHLFWCCDSEHLRALDPPGHSYGFSADADLRIENFTSHAGLLRFDITFRKKSYCNIELRGLGRHSALNAAGVFGLALMCGVSEETIRLAFAKFAGVCRRLERRFEGPFLSLFDDYAHHPTAVTAVLSALTEAYPDRRLVVAFQPHRYSRLKSGLKAFARGLELADRVLVTPVFAAGEQPAFDVSDSDLIEEINRIRPKAARGVRMHQLASSLIEELRPHDLLVTLGAGDITGVHGLLAEHFEKNRPRPLKVGCIYGGLSSENQVSKWSWENVAEALDPDLYAAEHFYIDIRGVWSRGDGRPFSFDDLATLDVALPILHGPNGEDGSLAGLFHVLGVEMAGCGILAAALAMDKDLMRLVVSSLGFDVVPTLAIWRWQWRESREEVVRAIEKRFGIPCFIKPVSLGSTDGVTHVHDRGELAQVLEQLFELDEKLVAEPVMEGRELEFALVGTGGAARALLPGEVFSGGNVYGFDSKYSDSGPITTAARAVVEGGVAAAGQRIAEAIYRGVGGSGLARLDFFYDTKKKQYFFNEMNPIPGFTDWSLYPKMLESAGIEFGSFISSLVADARVRGAARRRTVARYVK